MNGSVDVERARYTNAPLNRSNWRQPTIAACVGCFIAIAVAIVLTSCSVRAATPIPLQQTTDGDAAQASPPAASDEEPAVEVAEQIQVAPLNSDEQIENRLQQIMQATGWFEHPSVEVDRGVVFLGGTADTANHQQWAEATAMKTSDVVAVVNRIEVAEKPLWNFEPALVSLEELGRESIAVLPLVVIAVIIGLLSYFIALTASRFCRWFMNSRVESQLLRQVSGNVVAVLVFIIGLYVALRVSGLTRLAVTVLGGTGLVGLALGFAFRDIAENYLASILISLHRPFRVGDLIEVEGVKGLVRKVTTRGTILNTLDGNQIQMPNSTVYKGKITNYTATPLIRKDFLVGVGFDDSIGDAQQVLMDVLSKHVAVVDDPAPIVVVESLGSATVNLRVYYWFDQTRHSVLKVGSSVIRQAKRKLTDAGITMPDEARELVFPQGVPVQMLSSPSAGKEIAGTLEGQLADAAPQTAESAAFRTDLEPEPTTSAGEGDLGTEQDEVLRATDNDETIEGEANLIG